MTPDVEKVIEVLESVAKVKVLFLSEQSMVSDFMEHLDEEADQRFLAELSEKLARSGNPIKADDFIYDIANKVPDGK